MQRVLPLLIAIDLMSGCSTFRPITSPERNAKLRRSFALASKISALPCKQYTFKVQNKDVLVSVFKNTRNIGYSAGELEININEDQGILTEHMRSLRPGLRPGTMEFTDRVLDALIRKQESTMAERHILEDVAAKIP
jgi:hypothetical protein